MPSAVELVRRFRRVRALVIGDAMLDSYLEGTAARLCTEGPVPIVRKTAEHRAPGGAANTAANLRALGAYVAFLGIVGRDQAGALLRAAFHEQGVDDRWLVEDSSYTTCHKLRILADGQYVVRFDEGSDQQCSPQSQRELLANLDKVFARCDLVVVSDYGYGAVTEEVVARLRALRTQRPCVLLVDSKQLHKFRHCGATVITPNHLEAQVAAGTGMGSDAATRAVRPTVSEIEGVGRRLLAAIDAEHAAITMAADGVLLMDRHGVSTHIPAHPVSQPNDVGAGDSFAASMALALSVGARPVEAAQIGLDGAAIAVARRRTSIVHYQELLQRVSLRDHLADPPARAGNGVASALSRVTATVAEARRSGRTVVFTNGVFDILHAGHVQLLRQARALGDMLVVGVNSDSSVRRLKGSNRPINSERDRLALVAALDVVDHAVLFDDDTPTNLIRVLAPHIHVKGGDYADEDLPEARAVEEVGGRVVIVPLAGSHSTSEVIDRIVTLHAARRQEALS